MMVVLPQALFTKKGAAHYLSLSESGFDEVCRENPSILTPVYPRKQPRWDIEQLNEYCSKLRDNTLGAPFKSLRRKEPV
jgi:hypothetical protein